MNDRESAYTDNWRLMGKWACRWDRVLVFLHLRTKAPVLFMGTIGVKHTRTR